MLATPCKPVFNCGPAVRIQRCADTSFQGLSSSGYQRLAEDGFDGVQSQILLTPSRRKCLCAGLLYSAAGIVKPARLLAAAQEMEAAGLPMRHGYRWYGK